MFDDLNDDNVLIYAMKVYDKPNCIMSEFKEDMKRFNYLKRLFFRYRKFDELRERLIINHLVVIMNVFGFEATTRLLFYKMSKTDYSALKTYMLFLNIMPDTIRGIKGQTILSSDIPVDTKIADSLRNIK